MYGKLELLRTNRQGDVLRGKSVRVLNAYDNSPAKLYLDSLGQQEAASNVLTPDEDGRISAFARGRFKIVDSVVTDNVLRELVEVPGLTFTPMNFAGVGRGVEDDAGALNVAIETAKTFAGLMGGEVNRVWVDGEDRKYAVSSTIVVGGVVATGKAGVSLKNCTLVPHESMPSHEWLLQTNGSRAAVRDVTCDGERRVNCAELASYGGHAEGLICYHFPSTGIKVSGPGDQVLRSCESFQWFGSDDEFLDPEAWTGVPYVLDTNDLRMIDCIGHHGLRVLEITGNGGTTTIVGCNFYNGNFVAREQGDQELIEAFYNPQTLLVHESVNGINFAGCYIGDGRLDLHSYGVSFKNCIPIGAEEDGLEYFIGLHAHGTEQPYQIQLGDWVQVSSTFGSPSDGKVPFIKFIQEDGSFAGSYAAFEDAPGAIKSMHETLRLSRAQNDQGLNVVYYAPGPGGASGAGVGLVSGSTPQKFWRDPAGLREINGGAYLHLATRWPRTVSGAFNVPLTDSGREIRVNNLSAANAFFPHDAYVGWYVWICLGAGSAANYGLRTEAAYPSSTISEVGVEGQTTLSGKGDWRQVVCVGNNANFDGATFEIRGGPRQAGGGTGNAVWGQVGGTLANQTDLNAVLNALTGQVAQAIQWSTGGRVIYASAWGVPATGDATAALQALHDHMASNGGGLVMIDRMYTTLRALWWKDIVNALGLNETQTGIKKDEAFQGRATMMLVPTIGKQVGKVSHVIGHMFLDGSLAGQIGGTCKITRGSNVMTNVELDGGVTLPQGTLLKCAGLRPGTYVESHVGPNITMSVAAQYNNFNVARPHLDKPKLYAIPAVATTAVSVLDQAELTLPSQAVADKVHIGMRCYGQNLATDGQDLNQWTYVTSKSGLIIGISTKAALGGNFQLLLTAESDGLYGIEAAAAEDYNEALTYRAIHMPYLQVGFHTGNGRTFRGGCHGLHFEGGKTFSNRGKGHVTTGCNDQWNERCSIGENLEENEVISAGATPRGRKEIYSHNNPYLPSMRLRGVRETEHTDMDVTGGIAIHGASGEQLPINIVNNNINKWSAGMRPPDDTYESYFLMADNTTIQSIGGGYKGEVDDLPTHFFRSENGGSLLLVGQDIDVADTSVKKPYRTAFTNAVQSVQRITRNSVTGALELAAYAGISLASELGIKLGDSVTLAGLLRYVLGTNADTPQLVEGGTYNVPLRQVLTSFRNANPITNQTIVLPAVAPAGESAPYYFISLAGIANVVYTAVGGVQVNYPPSWNSLPAGTRVGFMVRSNGQYYPAP